MTIIEKGLISAIITVVYEPDIKECSEKYGDYGGFDIERRMCIKSANSNDQMDSGYELFVTTIHEKKYVGLYRTWVDDEYGSRDGQVEILVPSYIGCFKYAMDRLCEVERLTKIFSGYLSEFD